MRRQGRGFDPLSDHFCLSIVQMDANIVLQTFLFWQCPNTILLLVREFQLFQTSSRWYIIRSWVIHMMPRGTLPMSTCFSRTGSYCTSYLGEYLDSLLGQTRTQTRFEAKAELQLKGIRGTTFRNNHLVSADTSRPINDNVANRFSKSYS